MSIIQTQCDIVDHLDQNSGGTLKNKIREYANLNVRNSLNLYGDFYSQEVTKMASWEEVYKELDHTILKPYDYLYIMSGMDLHRSGLTRFGNRVGVFPKDSGQLRFQSHGKLMTIVLAMLKAHREYGKPLHEYQYDTGEISCRLFHPDYRPIESLYASYYNHDIPEFDIRRMDSLQYYLQSKSSLFDFDEKEIDFAFAYTVLKSSTRQDYPKFVDELTTYFKNSKIFTKNEFTGIDTSVDPEQYFNIVKKSRFTLVLPAYDQHSYAIDRFITSLHCNCLPLLHKDGNHKVVEDSYGVSLNPLVITKPEDVIRFTENRRLELLEEYREKFLKVEKGLVEYD